MSENKYVVKCPRCDNVIGLVMEVEGVFLLQMGGGLCHGWHGVCAVCGEGIHWSMATKILKNLIERMRIDNSEENVL